MHSELKQGKLYRITRRTGSSLHTFPTGEHYYQAQRGEIIMFLKEEDFENGTRFHWLYKGIRVHFNIWHNSSYPEDWRDEISALKYNYDEVDLLLESGECYIEDYNE